MCDRAGTGPRVSNAEGLSSLHLTRVEVEAWKGNGLVHGFPGQAAARRGMGSVVLELTAFAPAGLRARIPELNPRMTLWLQMMNNTTG